VKKRILIVALWFYAVWYAAEMATYSIGYPEVLAPIAGAIAAVVIAAGLSRATRSTRRGPQDDKVRTSIANNAGQEVS
jgi:hypothetical protein